jgi:hypothetical protein
LLSFSCTKDLEECENSGLDLNSLSKYKTSILNRYLADSVETNDANANGLPDASKESNSSAEKPVKPEQGSILQNSISAENFSDKIFILKFWTNIYPKTTDICL